MKFKGNTWGSEVMIFAVAQMIGKDIVTYINSQ